MDDTATECGAALKAPVSLGISIACVSPRTVNAPSQYLDGLARIRFAKF